MTNTELLRASPMSLTGLDKQRQFLLQMAMIKKPCPHCGAKVSQIEAYGTGEVDSFPVNGADQDNRYACPECKTALHHCLPLIGHAFWMTERAWNGPQAGVLEYPTYPNEEILP